MSSFEAIINVPGYLPQADEAALFETPAGAWAYLAEEREHSQDYGPGDGSYDETTLLLRKIAEDPIASSHTFPDGTGVICGSTPDYDGDHDLGLVYSVVLSEEEVPE